MIARRATVLTTVLPHRPRTGSEIATANIVAALRETCGDVTVLGFLRPGDAPPSDASYVAVGTRPIESRTSRRRSAAWMLEALLRRQAYSVTKYRSRHWRPHVERQGKSDLVIVDHSQLGFLVPAARLVSRRVVVVLHNIEHRMYEQAQERVAGLGARMIYGREGRALGRAERKLLHAVDEAWFLTAADAAYGSRIAPGIATRVLELPGLPDATATGADVPASEETFDVGLLASWTWRPNREALQWFLASILPRLPAGISIGVAGAGAPELGSRDDLRYEGAVPDAAAFLNRARVIAIPTLSGGGIQIKTLDAIATDRTIVATSVALRGIDDPPPTVFVVDDAEGFAEALVSAVGRAGSGDGSGRAWAVARRERLRAQVAHAFPASPELGDGPAPA